MDYIMTKPIKCVKFVEERISTVLSLFYSDTDTGYTVIQVFVTGNVD